MTDANDPMTPACPTCGGVLAASKTFCLACGRLIAPPGLGGVGKDPPVALPRGTASLAGRLVARGTGWLGGKPGGDG